MICYRLNFLFINLIELIAMKEIVQLSTRSVCLKRNEFLTVAGNIDTNVYHIESGTLRVYVQDGNEEQMVRFGYQDNLIVALDSFLTDQPSLFYIQAIKSAQVNVITKAKLKQFISVGQNNILRIGILENLIMQQMNREIDILTSSPKERYKRVLARSPQLFQQIPHKYIANYLRMSAETLSRLKKS